MGEDHVCLIVNHFRKVDKPCIPAEKVGDVRGENFQRLSRFEMPGSMQPVRR